MDPGFVAMLVGIGLCFVVPATSFVAGVYVGRYGSPVTVTWRGVRDNEE
jgi:hypothetical protein